MSFIVVIPARNASTRLPGKPLLDIGGLPMVIRTAKQASQSKASQVIIATDSQQIADVAKQHGFQAIITAASHPTGTDRLAEVCDILNLGEQQIVVNVQGDEPFIEPQLIDAVAELLIREKSAAITTCACPINSADTLFDPNVVKLVAANNTQALYFSRAPIPWARDAIAQNGQCLAAGLPAWQHIGLYAYRAHFLRAFPKLPKGQLEQFESLEQLRAMENGFPIFIHFSDIKPAKGIDTPADLETARARFDPN